MGVPKAVIRCAGAPRPETLPCLTLFLVGAALVITQFAMLRDFVAILSGEEAVAILVTVAFAVGLSVGYALAGALSERAFRRLFAASAGVHLTFPFSLRYIAAWIGAWELGEVWSVGLLVAYALLSNAALAAFVPRAIDRHEDGGGEVARLRLYYRVQIAGSMVGVVLVALSWNRPAAVLLVPYWVVIGSILFLTVQRRGWTLAYAAAALTAVLFMGELERHSNALLYARKHAIGSAAVLYSVNTAYQKVEVVEDGEGTRHLYLDGRQARRSTDLEVLDYFAAELPAALLRPRRVLLIGAGTLSCVPKVHPYAGQLTVLEPNDAVVEASRRFFTARERLRGLERWDLRVDDGRRFLRRTTDLYDLVVVDVPAPRTMWEATFHSVEFFRLVLSRLSPRGVVAVPLGERLRRSEGSAADIVAALAAVFEQVLVVNSVRADRGFAYASLHLRFGEAEIRREALEHDSHLEVISPPRLGTGVARAAPRPASVIDATVSRGVERFVAGYLDG